MEYLVLVIYVIVVSQFINSKPTGKGGTSLRGREFYKAGAFSNMIIGFIGVNVVNYFLRDKGIIPQAFVWIAIIGFFLMVLYGIYCLFRYIVMY